MSDIRRRLLGVMIYEAGLPKHEAVDALDKLIDELDKPSDAMLGAAHGLSERNDALIWRSMLGCTRNPKQIRT
jgi:hypothetical protein